MVVRGPDGGVQVISRAWSTGRVNLKAKKERPHRLASNASGR